MALSSCQDKKKIEVKLCLKKLLLFLEVLEVFDVDRSGSNVEDCIILWVLLELAGVTRRADLGHQRG